jgi:heme-degrading monooxygenase HmoA
MINILVRHTIADYATWLPVFDAHEALRRANGATGVGHVYRDEENPNQITTILEWDTAENARRFSKDPALKEAMHAAGVTSAPEIYFLNRA